MMLLSYCLPGTTTVLHNGGYHIAPFSAGDAHNEDEFSAHCENYQGTRHRFPEGIVRLSE